MTSLRDPPGNLFPDRPKDSQREVSWHLHSEQTDDGEIIARRLPKMLVIRSKMPYQPFLRSDISGNIEGERENKF